jgi:hypothetical protein
MRYSSRYNYKTEQLTAPEANLDSTVPTAKSEKRYVLQFLLIGLKNEFLYSSRPYIPTLVIFKRAGCVSSVSLNIHTTYM